MKKPLRFFLFLWFFTITTRSFSQDVRLTKDEWELKGIKKMEAKPWNISFSTGMMNFFGDIGNETISLPSATRLGYAVALRYLFNPALSIQAHLGYGHIKADDRAREDWFKRTGEVSNRNWNRGLSVRTTVTELSFHVVYTFGGRNQTFKEFHLLPYIYAGVGMMYMVPKADLFKGKIDINNRYYFQEDGTIKDRNGNTIEKDGKYETKLRDWKTEGQKDNPKPGERGIYSNWQIVFPFMFGMRYYINDRFDLLADIGIRYTFTDYMDDVSDKYATYKQIVENFPNDTTRQNLTKYITDPTGLGSDGTGMPPYTSPRGNLKQGRARGDIFSYTSVGFTYKFGDKKYKNSYDWINPMMAVHMATLVMDKQTETALATLEDFDEDGVIDTLDKCPYTPPGIPVDDAGCPFDSDSDAVPDYTDKEAYTQSGAMVNFQGIAIISVPVVPVATITKPTTMIINGNISEVYGDFPISNCSVVLVDLNKQEVVSEILSKAEGSYTFEVFLNKTYAVIVNKKDYYSGTIKVTTDADKTHLIGEENISLQRVNTSEIGFSPYEVKENETLDNVAKQFNISIQEIRSLNSLVTDFVIPHQILRVLK